MENVVTLMDLSGPFRPVTLNVLSKEDWQKKRPKKHDWEGKKNCWCVSSYTFLIALIFSADLYYTSGPAA